MAKTPTEALRKTKTTDKKEDKRPKQNALLSFIATRKHGDVGKHNNGTTTGFKAVEKKAAKEYGSKAAGEKVAGAVYAKMRKK